jgi:hypothetical protein
MENEARELGIQATETTPEIIDLYQMFGFEEKKAPAQLHVMAQTEKTMCLDL